MAKTGYIDLTEAQEENFYKAIKSGNRFTHAHVQAKTGFFGRTKRARMNSKTLLKECKTAWASLTNEEKSNWKSADPRTIKNGWRLFVKDYCLRLGIDITDPDVPSNFHVCSLGRIGINNGINEVKLAQYHPSEYHICQRVVGKKAMYEPISITEILALPLELKIRFSSNLTKTAGNGFAKFYASVRNYYQGRNIFTNLEIDLLPEAGMEETWQEKSDTISSVLGSEIFYNLFLHFYKVKGSLLFDNLEANHSGQNWVRDPFCEDLTKKFSGGFSIINPRWKELLLPKGSTFESLYYVPATPGIYGKATFGMSIYGKEVWEWEKGVYGNETFGLSIYGKQ